MNHTNASASSSITPYAQTIRQTGQRGLGSDWEDELFIW
jgi:hypothetical protein